MRRRWRTWNRRAGVPLACMRWWTFSEAANQSTSVPGAKQTVTTWLVDMRGCSLREGFGGGMLVVVPPDGASKDLRSCPDGARGGDHVPTRRGGRRVIPRARAESEG